MSKHKTSFFRKIQQNWFLNTPQRALLLAYEAAWRIRDIEEKHFNGRKISSESAEYTASVLSYWQSLLEKNLKIINLRLAEFQRSHSLLKISDQTFISRLKFIDEVTAKYAINREFTSRRLTVNSNSKLENTSDLDEIEVKIAPRKIGLFPGSITRSLQKIIRELSPQAEKQIIQDFQFSSKRTKTALTILATLIIVPFFTYLLSKQLLIYPIVERVRNDATADFFMNSHIQNKALHEFKFYQDKLKFDQLTLQAPPLSSEVIQQKKKEKAIQIAEEYHRQNNSAISNVFADLISLIVFALIIVTSKREIAILKLFIDDTVYGLSDSAKAFLIILITDIFVGFHSPHGWEIILEEFAQHLGITPTRNTIFIFIATFPVILDTVSKYWVFSYLSRISPSALATFKEMNE
ncbi:proton extrusion protein PcxA [Plectonema cf. radiosum LEGE 06105]|uniref:Proton extrusion protein PxcA n=1 Tax=Plectonema cf. radiosum LEGE 06105 TaxID=945769 RepID=A0A8J7F4R0_9CYAN|nr:proton extrusion protein PcxA [Plectonema radiosum]MBE9216411.1 proton extrusion protein PcxA [Plectonema cf. radiosum LEGE 06105]